MNEREGKERKRKQSVIAIAIDSERAECMLRGNVGVVQIFWYKVALSLALRRAKG